MVLQYIVYSFQGGLMMRCVVYILKVPPLPAELIKRAPKLSWLILHLPVELPTFWRNCLDSIEVFVCEQIELANPNILAFLSVYCGTLINEFCK